LSPPRKRNLSTGVLARSLYLVSWSEACRHVIAYWIFVLSILLVIDIFMLPLLERVTTVSVVVYVLLRSLTFAVLSSERVASEVAERLRINLDVLKILGESKEYVRLANAVVIGSVAIMLFLISVIIMFSDFMHGIIAADLILIGIVMLNVALNALLIRPKCLAFVASSFASLAVLYVILIPLLYGELTVSMMAISLVCSDAFAILGLNVMGVQTCLDATKSSRS